MSNFTFRPAVRSATSLLIGLAGPSSSGKTYSALRMATGLAAGGPIFMVDTESKRGLHYADVFTFQHGDLGQPFTPMAYREAIKAAKDAGAAVCIVDSMSHEHEGPGGILEMHEAEMERMAGDDWKKRERVKFSAWIKPKREHNQLVNEILQLNMHVICCFRAKQKLELVKGQGGKIEPVPLGWQPICSDRFEYEMGLLLMLPPNSKGMPDLAHESTKLQEQHRAIFPAGQQITEQMGSALAEWASGKVDKAPATRAPAPPVNKITLEQEDKLRLEMDRVKADPQGFLNFLGIKALTDLPADSFDYAMGKLKEKERKAKEKALKAEEA